MKSLEKGLKRDGFDDGFVDFLQDLDKLSASIRSGGKDRVLSAEDRVRNERDESSDNQDIGGEDSDDDDDDDDDELDGEDEDEENDDGEEEEEPDGDADDYDDEGTSTASMPLCR